jgi:hypothetical protein
MQLLTAKLAPKDLAGLKKLMLRPGFVEEWDSLDALAQGFAKVLLAKQNTVPSASFKLFTSYDPEAVLWLGFTSKVPAVQERFHQFLKVWPEARQRTPHALMQEMRITPELPGYADLVQAIFLELIDDRLATPEEMRAYLEPHSPPAPPPQVSIKRPRAKRGAEAKIKEQVFDEDEESEEALGGDDEIDDMGGDDDELDLGLSIPKGDLEPDPAEEEESGEDDDLDSESEAPVAKRSSKKSAAEPPQKPSKASSVPDKAPAVQVVEKPVKAGKAGPASHSKPEAKSVPETKPPANGAKPGASPAKSSPPAPAKAAKESKPAKPVAKSSVKPVKAAAKTPVKSAPAKHPPAKAKPVHTAAKSAKAAHGAKSSKAPEKKHPAKPAKKR